MSKDKKSKHSKEKKRKRSKDDDSSDDERRRKSDKVLLLIYCAKPNYPSCTSQLLCHIAGLLHRKYTPYSELTERHRPQNRLALRMTASQILPLLETYCYVQFQVGCAFI